MLCIADRYNAIYIDVTVCSYSSSFSKLWCSIPLNSKFALQFIIAESCDLARCFKRKNVYLREPVCGYLLYQFLHSALRFSLMVLGQSEWKFWVPSITSFYILLFINCNQPARLAGTCFSSSTQSRLLFCHAYLRVFVFAFFRIVRIYNPNFWKSFL